ncbi:heavy metal sensor histidine kinase [Acinetobacter rudis]|nr:heavy metal sensor histidine kinase [Acinetobacter rudis]
MLRSLYDSLSFRITFIFAIISVCTLLVMGAVIHHLVLEHFDQQDKKVLDGKVELIQHLLESQQFSDQQFHAALQQTMIGHDELMVMVQRENQQFLFNSFAHLDAGRPIKVLNQNWFEWEITDRTYRGYVINKPFVRNMGQETFLITVAIDNTAHHLFMLQFSRQLKIIGLLGMLGLVIFAWLAVRRGLNPIVKMSHVVKGITAQNLTQRLDLDHIPIELKSLATEFNQMLTRLEKALDKLSNFSSDLAHEIRTPINVLMTQTQVCLSQTRPIHDYQEVLFSNLEEFERLAKMTADLLFLAKAEHQLELIDRAPIDLQHEMANLLDYYDALASEKGMQLLHHGEATISGDVQMLRRALSNLIANAIQYGLANTPIRIDYQQSAKQVVLNIENQAETLTSAQLDNLFDRFYRADISRQKTIEGTGLGLAITQSILELHQAKIEVQSQEGWVRFSLVFPVD